MMTRKIVFFLMLGFIVSCSTGSHKKADSSTPDSSNRSSKNLTGIEEDKASSKSSSSSTSSEAQSEISQAAAQQAASEQGKAGLNKSSEEKKTSSNLNDQLTEAIRNQKDENIYKYSGQILLENPNDLRALNAMAIYNYKRGRYSASEYLLKKALQQNNSSSQVHSNLGLIHLAKKERKEAVLEFRKALEISPEDPVAAANLGSVFIEEKDYSKAEIALEIAYRKGWRDYKVLANYAIALAAMGKAEKAESLYKEIFKEQTSSKEILFNYAVLQIEHLGKYSDGLETINRLKFIGAPSEIKKRLSSLESKAKAKMNSNGESQGK